MLLMNVYFGSVGAATERNGAVVHAHVGRSGSGSREQKVFNFIRGLNSLRSLSGHGEKRRACELAGFMGTDFDVPTLPCMELSLAGTV